MLQCEGILDFNLKLRALLCPPYDVIRCIVLSSLAAENGRRHSRLHWMDWKY